MSDFETIKAMLDRAGIYYACDPTDLSAEAKAKGATQCLRVDDGYVGFVSIFEFNEDGSLIRLAAWE